LARALKIGARVVGVNARDLGTFAEDLGVGERLVADVPPEVVLVAESAIRSRADAERMAAAGFDAVLVGEMLVKSDDPTASVRELASVPRRPRA
jgi:indole-3-glycerol phosphate synthase